MTLDNKLKILNKQLDDENFENEELRNECIELTEWLEELIESRKAIKTIQEQLLNSSICVLSHGEMGDDYD